MKFFSLLKVETKSHSKIFFSACDMSSPEVVHLDTKNPFLSTECEFSIIFCFRTKTVSICISKFKVCTSVSVLLNFNGEILNLGIEIYF